MLFEKGMKKVQKHPQFVLFCNIIHNKTQSFPKMALKLIALSLLVWKLEPLKKNPNFNK